MTKGNAEMTTSGQMDPREAMADTWDGEGCNSGMSLAYAVAKAAAEYVLTWRAVPEVEMEARKMAAHEIAYDAAFHHRHHYTLPRIVEYATATALMQAKLDRPC